MIRTWEAFRMTIEQLRAMHTARPFRAFRIHMADGRDVEVQHPEFLAHTPSGRTIMVAKGDETFEIVDLLLVTSLEPTNSQTRRSGRKKTKPA
jgi:hypothetical protein